MGPCKGQLHIYLKVFIMFSYFRTKLMRKNMLFVNSALRKPVLVFAITDFGRRLIILHVSIGSESKGANKRRGTAHLTCAFLSAMFS